MATFDTNVVLRVLHEDDAEQHQRARRRWERALAQGGIFLPAVVLTELAWVLRVSVKRDRASIAGSLRDLCDTEGVTIEHEDRVRRALARYETGAADFSDYLILEAGRDAGALPVVTFDERFGRDGEVEIPNGSTP